MKGTIHRCPDCGSTDVQVLEWHHANTGLLMPGDPERLHCTDCDVNVKKLTTVEGEIPGTPEQFLNDIAGSNIFNFVLDGHVLPREIREEWGDLQARMQALTGT